MKFSTQQTDEVWPRVASQQSQARFRNLGFRVKIPLDPYGSKDPNNRDLLPQYYTVNVTRVQGLGFSLVPVGGPHAGTAVL